MTQLLTAPLKLARFAARTGLDAGRFVLRRVRGHDEHPAPRPPARTPRAPGAAPPRRNAAPRRRNASPAQRTTPPPPTPAAPRHVSREAEVVASSGPADDPGATVHVAEPWDGYDRAPAREIIARLRDADAATRAAVALYERQGKQRATVLEAARG